MILSKAERMFYFFKSKGIIQGEKFDLELTFKNVGDVFPGGFCDLVIDSILYDKNISRNDMEISPLDKNQSITKKLENLIIDTSGLCGVSFENQCININEGQNGIPYLYDFRDKPLSQYYLLCGPVTSKEELYQKYSVIVAIWVAIVSIIISTIGIFLNVFL